MTRLAPAAMALGLVAAATPTSAACRWFGTQLECQLGGREVLIGTQAEDEPVYVRPFRPAGLHAGGFVDDRVAPEQPFRVELQDIGADPHLSRESGGETYCY